MYEKGTRHLHKCKKAHLIVV